jgi:prepilin-type N-terminal cleavage/methylation domain-containing protein
MTRRPAPRAEGAFTLVELLVAILVMSIVAGATTSVAVSMLRTESQVVETSDVLAEARAGLVRTQTELREAKRLHPETDPDEPCDPRRLDLWVDHNRDGVPQLEEQVTYELVEETDEPGVARLERWTDAAPSSRRIIARRIEYADIFTCSPAPPDTRVIDIELTIVGAQDLHSTDLDSSVRLRNVD